MKISLIRTVAISAYLSAMLASNVAPVRNNATLAAPFDPEIMRVMAENLNGGAPISHQTAISAPAPITVATNQGSKHTIDAISRLRAFTLSGSDNARIIAKAARLLGLADREIPTKQIASTLTDGKLYFTVSIQPNSDDIFLTVKRNGAPLTLYLTNSNLELRATLVNEPGNPISEKTDADFQALLQYWTEQAKTLPASTLINNS